MNFVKVFVECRGSEPGFNFNAPDTESARRMATEEAQWESCLRVRIPSLRVVVDGTFATADELAGK